MVQAYGIKVRCYEEHVGEHIGNLRNILRTHWELNGNIHWEPWKIEKKNPPPTPNLKGKKARHLDGMLGPSHWLLHEISLPKRVSHHFWPGLIITSCKEHLTHYMFRLMIAFTFGFAY